MNQSKPFNSLWSIYSHKMWKRPSKIGLLTDTGKKHRAVIAQGHPTCLQPHKCDHAWLPLPMSPIRFLPYGSLKRHRLHEVSNLSSLCLSGSLKVSWVITTVQSDLDFFSGRVWYSLPKESADWLTQPMTFASGLIFHSEFHIKYSLNGEALY